MFLSHLLYTIPSATDSGAKWESETRKILAENAKSPQSLEELLSVRHKSLSLSAYLRLKLLHRQFTGKNLMGLRLVVRSARHTVRGLKRIPFLGSRFDKKKRDE